MNVSWYMSCATTGTFRNGSLVCSSVHFYENWIYHSQVIKIRSIKFIHKTGKDKTLSWIQRLQIAIDSAKGLLFLHTFPDGCIVHRDIKVLFFFFFGHC